MWLDHYLMPVELQHVKVKNDKMHLGRELCEGDTPRHKQYLRVLPAKVVASAHNNNYCTKFYMRQDSASFQIEQGVSNRRRLGKREKE